MDVVAYLSKVLEMEKKDISLAKERERDYREIRIPKKDKTFRRILAPSSSLKRFQRKFLEHYLYTFTLVGQEDVIHGFKPHRSPVSNAKYHADRKADFVLKLDIKDAFPSVTAEHLRALFRKVIPMFIPVFARKDEMLEEFIEFLLPLLTFDGVLPQGAPTSPYLLNLVLCHSGLVAKIREFLRSRGNMVLSIYADDFAISSTDPIPNEVKDGLIELIETESDFRINRDKIFYFKRDSVAPLVTGLRIVKQNDNGGKTSFQVRLPKKTVRKIRGLIHRFTYADPELQRALRNVIRGHIAHLRQVYGKRLPRQVAIPYDLIKEELGG